MNEINSSVVNPTNISLAYALTVGVRSVDPKSPFWNGWDGSAIAKGVSSNISMMNDLFRHLYRGPVDKIRNEVLLEPKDLIKSSILNKLSSYANLTRAGDLFIFYFSGHGGQSSDKHQNVACYDQPLWDFDLKNIWEQFNPGARIVMIADCCHSGTTAAIFNSISAARTDNITISSHDPDRRNINAMLIYYSPTDDDHLSYSPDSGSFFTRAIYNVMNNGRYQGSYSTFYDDLKKEVAKLTAGFTDEHGKPIVLSPQYDELGPSQTIAFKKFREQRPFTIDFPREFLPRTYSTINTLHESSLIDTSAPGEPENSVKKDEVKINTPKDKLMPAKATADSVSSTNKTIKNFRNPKKNMRSYSTITQALNRSFTQGIIDELDKPNNPNQNNLVSQSAKSFPIFNISRWPQVEQEKRKISVVNEKPKPIASGTTSYMHNNVAHGSKSRYATFHSLPRPSVQRTISEHSKHVTINRPKIGLPRVIL